MKQKKLTILAILLALFLLGVTTYTIYRLTVNRSAFEQNLKSQVANIKPEPGKPGAKGDTGTQGLTVQGPKGDMGLQGAQGIQGTQGNVGSTGPQGIQGEPGPVGSQGEQGPQGTPGTNGREVEFRCNPANDNYEYRYVGDDNWQIIEPNSNTCKSSVL